MENINVVVAYPLNDGIQNMVSGTYPNEFAINPTREADIEYLQRADYQEINLKHTHPCMNRSREIVLELIKTPSDQVVSQLHEMAKVTEACSCRFRSESLSSYPEESKSIRRYGKDDMEIVQFINSAAIQVQLQLSQNRRSPDNVFSCCGKV